MAFEAMKLSEKKRPKDSGIFLHWEKEAWVEMRMAYPWVKKNTQGSEVWEAE